MTHKSVYHVEGISDLRSSDPSIDHRSIEERVMRHAPDFFIIGAMKAGSTSLWHQLQRHPEIFLCTPKEPQYFSHRRGWSRGADWYGSLFAAADQGRYRAFGEASTCYTRYPHYGDVAARIAAANPAAKLIYILRDPVDRVYSHYLHESERRALGDLPVQTLRDSWRSDPEYLDASRYIVQINQYMQWFSREQLFVCTLGELRENADALVVRTAEFLGCDARPLTNVRSPAVANQSLSASFADRAARRTIRNIREGRLGGFLGTLTPRRLRWFLRDRLHVALRKSTGRMKLKYVKNEISPLLPEDRAELVA